MFDMVFNHTSTEHEWFKKSSKAIIGEDGSCQKNEYSDRYIWSDNWLAPMAGHPYIGDFIEDGTPEQMTEAYKGLYPYVEDPSNNLNRSSQMLPSDVVFTTQLKELFQKTFIDGKENRVSRIRAQEYALAFQRASNLVVKCSNCGNWHYARPDGNHKYICPW